MTTCRRLLLLSSLLLALPVAAEGPLHGDHPPHGPPGAVAPGPAETDGMDGLERLLVLLSGHHGIPSRDELEAAIPNVRSLLWQVAMEREQHPIQRDRAIAALAWWGDEAVQELYRDLIRSADTSTMLRHRVVGLAARYFGEASIEDISPLLDHPDLQLRLTAADALGEIDTAASRALLREALHEGTPALLRERIEAALDDAR